MLDELKNFNKIKDATTHAQTIDPRFSDHFQVTFHPFGEWNTPNESLDKEGAVLIRSGHSWKDLVQPWREERDGDWSRRAKRALESCGLWCGQVKGKPLVEMTTEEGQTRNLKDKRVIRGLRQGKDELYQLVGRLKEGWMELDVLRPSTSDPRVIKERRKQDVFFGSLVKEICVLILHACDVWEENKRSN
ncbi:hypothetical protein F2Q69_00022864 [Brassica cretica]|uniref:Uncharacterized protein n=1 Tax=Brassica cretica TaxID=69181 RepID=A0A8S9Q9B5_BRACR|nr:hypothetical protein F2Q69_00022864 [Brassica cretica]